MEAGGSLHPLTKSILPDADGQAKRGATVWIKPHRHSLRGQMQTCPRRKCRGVSTLRDGFASQNNTLIGVSLPPSYPNLRRPIAISRSQQLPARKKTRK